MPVSNVTAGQDATASYINEFRLDVLQGWLEVSDTWTYSANGTLPTRYTITVPSDATTKYDVGMKVRLKQGGAYKYFYIIAVTTTTIVVTAGDDYSVANSTITNIAVSAAAAPLGFPHWFAYTPTWTGFSVDPSSVLAKFAVNGRSCTVLMKPGAAGVSNASTLTVSLPIVSLYSIPVAGTAGSYDNSVNQTAQGRIDLVAADVKAYCYKDFAQTGWTSSGSKSVFFTLVYPI